MALPFVITDAGREALINAANTGTDAVLVTQISLGSTHFLVSSSTVAVAAEIKRIPASGGGVVAPDAIHVSGSDSSADVYTVRSVGLYTSGGILLAAYSQADPILIKGAGTVALIAADLVITGLPAGAIAVGDTTFAYPQATETVKGVAELATIAETLNGLDDERIITPKKLASVTATDTRRGLIEIATTAEAQAGVDIERAMTPKTFQDSFATTTRKGVVELATSAETQDGVDNERAVTPSGLSSRTATMARTGLIEIATIAEAQAGVDDDRALTPKKLQDVTATDARAGVIKTASAADVAAAADGLKALTPNHIPSIITAVCSFLYPVGELLITRRNGNPGAWLGFGTWERYGEGRVLAGFDAADADFNVLDKTGGNKTITLTVGQLPVHNHRIDPPLAATSAAGDHTHPLTATVNGVLEQFYLINDNNGGIGSGPPGTFRGDGPSDDKDAHFLAELTGAGAHSHTVDIAAFDSGNIGGGEAHSNLQPYVTVFMWRRTA